MGLSCRIDKSWVFVAFAVLALHAYSMWAFGATFWYDSVNYFQLGTALIHGDLRDFYDGPRYYIFQHLMPGLPLLLGGLTTLFGRYGWVALASLQHFVAACSLLYFMRSLNHRLSPMWQLAAGVLICLHPFYMAFHNSPLTESLSSSMLLVVVAAAIRMVVRRQKDGKTLFFLTLAGILGVQLRSYAVAYALTCIAILLTCSEGYVRRRVVAGVGILIMSSLLVFPIYRWVRTGIFFMPNVDYVTLSLALDINPQVSEPTVRTLRGLSLPRGESVERIAAQGLSYVQAAEIAAHLKSLGYQDGEAKKLIKRMAWVVRTDSVGVVTNQLRLGLLSAGAYNVALLGSGERPFSRGYTLREHRSHERYYVAWFAWTKFDNYLPILDQLLERFKRDSNIIDDAARRGLESFLRPFFVTRGSRLRDPMSLVSLPLEVWMCGWIMGVALISQRNRAVGALFAVAPVVNYLVSVSVPVGQARYSHGLIPLYILVSMFTLSEFSSKSRAFRILGW